MATDISLLNNVVQIKVGASQPTAYIDCAGKYFFNAAGDILNLTLLPSRDTYSIPLASLTVAGAPVANAAAGYTALSSVFQK